MSNRISFYGYRLIILVFILTFFQTKVDSGSPYDFYNYAPSKDQQLAAVTIKPTKFTISDLPSDYARLNLKKEYYKSKETSKQPTKENTIKKKSSKYAFKRPFSQKLKPTREFSDDSFNPHRGVLYEPKPEGHVQSSMSGKVVAIDYMDGYGNYVILEHENGYTTVYANLNQVTVAEGQSVESKAMLGTLLKDKGLYFQVNVGRIAINPRLVVKH